ncbi:unnamed protein product [Microthlaspi erraticum]|uniref:Arabidopsis retrotransposon Orf1 C-terminal domain-containing protein n=1 Tax=Microthlaspi erraticum TaxID=1685480 RepID=A0A6D2KSB0_9BRAS|nr:unnamed protein product [Microthlaspi erraticum]
MVEGESSNQAMQAEKRMDQRMEGSDAEEYVYSEEQSESERLREERRTKKRNDPIVVRYPHDDTMRDLGIFEDVELVLKNMQLGKFFSHRMESYKELTCEFLASMKHHEFDELDRAFGFTYGEGNLWNIKEEELQRVWATIAEEVLFLKVQGCQIRACA